jgi:hypothetical protein
VSGQCGVGMLRPGVLFYFMKSSESGESSHSLLALWVVAGVEALMILAGTAYNAYEVRRNSELVQRKLEGLTQYTTAQGQKLDRMTTALEVYLGKKFSPEEKAAVTPAGEPAASGERIDKAIQFLEGLKKSERSE